MAEETDILIIGGGPAGMAAAIRARQIAEEKGAVCTKTFLLCLCNHSSLNIFNESMHYLSVTYVIILYLNRL